MSFQRNLLICCSILGFIGQLLVDEQSLQADSQSQDNRIALRRILAANTMDIVLDNYLKQYTISQLEDLAAQGDAQAATVVGMAYDSGRDLPEENPAKAREYYQQACSGGEPAGCGHLAEIYLRSEGIPPDLKKAKELLEQACDGDYLFSCYNLAYGYDTGYFGIKDQEAARRLYKDPCTAGLPHACNNLGVLHERGEGGPQSYVMARRFFQMACKLGDSEGCRNLNLIRNR